MIKYNIRLVAFSLLILGLITQSSIILSTAVADETASDFKVWKTIKLGRGLKTADDFRRALKKHRYDIDSKADQMLDNPAFTVRQTEMYANLVVVSVGELGFNNGAIWREICERAQSLGLSLCPAEVGPQLRLQYTDQPNDERLGIGMEPIASSNGDPHVFRVEHDDDGSQWLGAFYDGIDYLWRPNYRFVFMKGK